MSNFDPFPPDDDQEIYVAEIVDDFSPSHHDYQQPKKSGLKTALVAFGILGVIFLFLVVCGIATIILVDRADERASTTDPNEIFHSLSSGKQKWGPIRSGFSQPDSNVTQKTQDSVIRSLDKIISVSESEDADQMRRYVDRDGFMDQMVRSRFCTLNFLDRESIKQNFRVVTDGPTGFTKYKIASIKRIDEDEVLVYLHLWGLDGGIREYSLWLVESGTQWKLTDWESLRTGMSEASNYALLAEEQETQPIQDYYKATDTTAEGFELLFEGDYEKAEKKFEDSLRYTVHPALRDSNIMSNGFGIAQIGDWNRAIEIFEGVKNKDETPGAYYGLSLAHYQIDNMEEAISYADKYLDRVGVSPTAIQTKANSLFELNRIDEGLDQLESLIEIFPEEDDYLMAYARQLPADRADQLIDVLGDKPLEKAMMLTQSHFFLNETIFNKLVEVAEENGASKSNMLGLKARIATKNLDYPKATKFYEQAMKAESDSEVIEDIQPSYLSLMKAMDKTKEGFLACPLKAEAFQHMTLSYNEFGLSIEEKNELVKEMRDQKIKSHWIRYVEGECLAEKGDFTEAKTVLSQGLKDSLRADKGKTDQEKLSSPTAEYAYMLQRVLIELGEHEQAMMTGENRPSAFWVVAQSLSEKNQISKLKTITSQYRQWYKKSFPNTNEENPERETAKRHLDFYTAKINLEDDDKKAVGEILKIIADEENYYHQTQARTLLVDWSIEKNNWAELLPANTGREGLDEFADGLFDKLLAKESYEDIARLEKIHQRQRLSEATRINWKLSVAKDRDDSKSYLDAANSLTDQQLDELPYYQQRTIAADWIKMLLKTGEHTAALNLIQRLEKRNIKMSGHFKFACHVAMRDVEACRKMKVEPNWTRSDSGLLNVPGGIDYYRLPEFKDLRFEWPVSTEYRYQSEEIHFLFAEKPDFEKLKEKAIKLIPNLPESAKAASLPNQSDPNAIIDAHDKQWIMKLTKSKLIDYDSEDLAFYEKSESDVEIPEHEFVFSLFQVGSSKPVYSLEQAVKALADENCSAVYDSNNSILLHDPKDWVEKSKPNEKIQLGQLEETYLYLEDESSPDQPYWEKARVEKSRKKELEEKLEQGAMGIEILVDFRSCDLTEKHWFLIKKFETNEAGNLELTVLRNAKIQLFPELQPDEPHLVDSYQSIQWRETKK